MSFRKIAVLAVAVLPALPVISQTSAPADSVLSLTMDSAIGIALSENPTVKVASQEITKQEYSKKGVLASLFPTVNFSASYDRSIQKQVMYMGGEMGESMGNGGLKIGKQEQLLCRLFGCYADYKRAVVEAARHFRR